MSWKRRAAGTVARLSRAAGLSLGLRTARRKRRDFRLFILEYHGVDPAGREWEGTISHLRFRRHLEWLSRHFEFDTVTGARRRLSAGDLDRDWAVVTFDDGYANNVDGAFPVLQDLGIPATIYLTTGFLDGQELWFDIARRSLRELVSLAADGRSPAGSEAGERLHEAYDRWPPGLDDVEPWMRRLKDLPAEARRERVEDLRTVVEQCGLELGPAARPMSWQQARQLRDAGIELGAHTVHHPILSRLSPKAQETEIAVSMRRIEEELGARPSSFAIPNGSAHDYDQHTLDILRRLGFDSCCTTRRGSNPVGCDPLQLRRIGVGSDSIPLLEARLAGLFDESIRRYLPF